jgi:Flp pilus assembly protein TadD
MKASVFACLLLALSGCASQSTAVRCDTRLEPINMPAAKTLTRDNTNVIPDQQSIESEDRRD